MVKISHREHWHVWHVMYVIWSRVHPRGYDWSWMRRVVCLVVWRRLWYVVFYCCFVVILLFSEK